MKVSNPVLRPWMYMALAYGFVVLSAVGGYRHSILLASVGIIGAAACGMMSSKTKDNR